MRLLRRHMLRLQDRDRAAYHVRLLHGRALHLDSPPPRGRRGSRLPPRAGRAPAPPAHATPAGPISYFSRPSNTFTVAPRQPGFFGAQGAHASGPLAAAPSTGPVSFFAPVPKTSSTAQTDQDTRSQPRVSRKTPKKSSTAPKSSSSSTAHTGQGTGSSRAAPTTYPSTGSSTKPLGIHNKPPRPSPSALDIA